MKSVDGFMRVSRGTVIAPLTPMPAHRKPAVQYVAAPKAQAKPASDIMRVRVAHTPAVHVKPHAPQHTTTLMRSAVKKPIITSASVIKAQSRTDLLAKVPAQSIVPKTSYNSMNPVRVRRAERMIQSPAITKYAKIQPSVINRPVPQLAGSTPAARPASPMSVARPMRQAQSGRHYTQPAVAAPTAQDIDIFERALADAKTHEQSYTHKVKKSHKRGRLLAIVTGTVAGLLVLGFAAFHSVPTLSLDIASYRAGLHAKLPASKPSGFTFGYLDYKPGTVTANFTSPQDSRQFNITQKASSWDSQALLSNFVASASTAYKTYQQAGRTVYLLGNNTATWVDSGVWYTVDGNSSLSSKQLLQVAASM